MSAKKQVAQREAQAVQGKGEEPALVPAVDIYEDDHGITVQADMPGVAKERLNIQADRNSLLIEGEAAIDTPVGTEALYVDVPATRFRRSFVLSAELEPDRIEANLKDGLLTVRIPKRAEYRPRRIEVQTS
jgi:HSP20 family protein